MNNIAERIRHGVNGAKESAALREEAASRIDTLYMALSHAIDLLETFATDEEGDMPGTVKRHLPTLKAALGNEQNVSNGETK